MGEACLHLASMEWRAKRDTPRLAIFGFRSIGGFWTSRGLTSIQIGDTINLSTAAQVALRYTA